MKILVLLFLLSFSFISLENAPKKVSHSEINQTPKPKIAKIKEANFDIRNDTVIFNSGSIENFDKASHPIDVYWIGETRDTVVRLQHKYDKSKNLVGTETYQHGKKTPYIDTIYVNTNGLKVIESFDSDHKVSKKSIITTDKNENPVLKTYENGKGEFQGLDSLFFDAKNRVIKEFHEDSKGKRYGIILTYKYIKSDQYGNWTERHMYVGETLSQKQTREITYYK